MKVEITIEEYRTIRESLMERKAREVYGIIASLDSQVAEELKKENGGKEQ